MNKYFKYVPYLMLVFALALNSCSEDNQHISEFNVAKSTQNYSSYFYDGFNLSGLEDQMWSSLDSNPNMSQQDLVQELQVFLSNSFPDNPIYEQMVFSEDYAASNQTISDLVSEFIQLDYISNETKDYAVNLELAINESDDQMLLNLRDSYFSDISQGDTEDLFMLNPIFSIVNHYESQFESGVMGKRNCRIDGRTVLISAIIGGFSTALAGGTGGSLFGPVGTIGGFVGGFIYGAGMSTIGSIGAQGIACETRRR